MTTKHPARRRTSAMTPTGNGGSKRGRRVVSRHAASASPSPFRRMSFLAALLSLLSLSQNRPSSRSFSAQAFSPPPTAAPTSIRRHRRGECYHRQPAAPISEGGGVRRVGWQLRMSDNSGILLDNNDDDEEEEDDEEDEEEDEYAKRAVSEFRESDDNDDEGGDDDDGGGDEASVSALLDPRQSSRTLGRTAVDWGGALSILRDRASDVESGRGSRPPVALFRTVTRDKPNEAVGQFVREADPEVVAAMTGAVSALLGSLSEPSAGIETIVRGSGERLGNLCFQLQMTGYMFRNAEYVMALKDLMDIRSDGKTTLDDYEAAFRKLDADGSGYIEADEVEALLSDVYDGSPPTYEISTFLKFFDANRDGRISWEEFEKGFGAINLERKPTDSKLSLPEYAGGQDDDDDDDDGFGEPTVSGTIKVELDDGTIIEVEAQDYMNDLKEQALALKIELAMEKGIDPKELGVDAEGGGPDSSVKTAMKGRNGGIAGYIASLQGDVQSLTMGISPDVVESMRMLIDYVLEGGPGGVGVRRKGTGAEDLKKKEMELPASALQQLALWQLVLGYRLRETEAKEDWKKMIE